MTKESQQASAPVVKIMATLIGFTSGNPVISREFPLCSIALPTRVGDIVEVDYDESEKLYGFATDLMVTPSEEEGKIIVVKMRCFGGYDDTPAIQLGNLPSGWKAVGRYSQLDNPNLLITSSISA